MKNDPKVFDHWMEEVDAMCKKDLGCSVRDLPDRNYWDMWQAGVGPSEMFEEIRESIKPQ